MKIKNKFSGASSVWFKETDIKKIQMMSSENPLHIISTVCPDYSNDGQRYTFSGEMGSSISLTALEHLKNVPALIEVFHTQGFRVEWTILVADLPEIVEEEFVSRVAGTTDQYLDRCKNSAKAIQSEVGELVSVETFTSFYSVLGIDYLAIQRSVAKRILLEGEIEPFHSKFVNFATGRRDLAEKFRGRRLSEGEILHAGAHGMSLYITHGTLLRHIFLGKNLVVVNHQTPNLQNFYLCNFVSGYEHLLNTPKFPLGILKKELY